MRAEPSYPAQLRNDSSRKCGAVHVTMGLVLNKGEKGNMVIILYPIFSISRHFNYLSYYDETLSFQLSEDNTT